VRRNNSLILVIVGQGLKKTGKLPSSWWLGSVRITPQLRRWGKENLKETENRNESRVNVTDKSGVVSVAAWTACGVWC